MDATTATNTAEIKAIMTKSEHSHPVWNVGIHPFSHENDHGKALKNGAYPFKSAKIGPKIGALPFS